MMITALMGVYAYRANQKGDQVKTGVATAQTAIDGLAKLADLHAKEIIRIDASRAECEDARAALTEKVARMDGQIDVLKTVNTTAVAEAARVAAGVVQTAAREATQVIDAAHKKA